MTVRDTKNRAVLLCEERWMEHERKEWLITLKK